MKLFAPAKVNLSLRVLGKRPNGFHEIETLIVPLTLGDALNIEATDGSGIEFTCSDPSVPDGEDNLVVRAARSFFAKTGGVRGVRIALEKRTPHGAGLGGGSSDAAITLAGLNRLFDAPLGADQLHELAAEIGSDVPFFMLSGAAWCRGRGEEVEGADFAERLPLVLFKPAFGVPTPQAYSRWQDSRETPELPYAAQEFPWGRLFNDLERPVFQKYIVLGMLKRWLLARKEVAGALMSGSGSTVFAILRDATAGETLARDVRAEFGASWWAHPCETLPAFNPAGD